MRSDVLTDMSSDVKTTSSSSIFAGLIRLLQIFLAPAR
jgi:hypothetical protein